MNRRSFLKNTTLTAGLLSLGSKELFAALIQQPAYQLTSLRNDVGIFTEKGGTIAYYLSKDGIIVVDTEFPEAFNC